MKLRVLLGVLLFAMVSVASVRPEAIAEAGAQVTVDSVRLVDVGTDEIRLEVSTHAMAVRKVTAKRIEFEQMEVNGLPFQVEPLVERVVLNPNQPVDLPPVMVRVRVRDLASFEPFLEAVSSGRAQISGVARVTLDLNFLERLFSGHITGQAKVDVQGEISFDVPGGDAGRAAMLVALRGMELVKGTLGILQ